MKKKGQSTVEYLILVAGIIIVLVVFLKPNGPMHTKVNQTMNDMLDFMQGMVDDTKAKLMASKEGNNGGSEDTNWDDLLEWDYQK